MQGGHLRDSRALVRFYGGVENRFLLLQVQHETQLRQRQTGGTGQPEQIVVEIHRITAQTPVMRGT